MESINDELEFLKGLVKGIASQFGSSCEVVLLDLSNFEENGSAIVHIENGHITNRKVGDSGTNLGLEVLRGTDLEGDKHNYVTQSKNGRTLKSTTMYIRNSQNIPIGCICLNFDITELIMAEKTIENLTSLKGTEGNVNEFFVNDVNELLDKLIQEAQDHVGKPVALMNKEDKIIGVDYLDKKGALLIKKSSEKVCKHFNISKYTLYNYLDEAKEKDKMR